MPDQTKIVSKRRKVAVASHPVECPRLTLARRLDLLAGIELQHGHPAVAERLAWQAAEMREVAR
jgi:hypothetical protein